MSGLLAKRLRADSERTAEPGNAITSRLKNFGRNEGGALMMFGLLVLVMMLVIGGLAVDVMRTETVRVRLANTSDAATLAAASLSNVSDPNAVVTDYFAKAGLSAYLKGVSVSSSTTTRSVSADVGAQVPTFFTHMIGIDSLSAPADSTAEQSASNLEISLVLDVSGSMNRNSKLQNLKVAASQFVDTVMAGDFQNRISISIIPFNGQVNLGATLAGHYTISGQHALNTCVDLDPASFTQPAILRTTLLTRTDVIDPWHGGILKPKPNGITDQNYCTTDARTIVRPFLRDIATLKAAINGLVAEGNTSIDVGMKWGIAMLDPGTRPVISTLIGAGEVPASFAGRPAGYGAARASKVVVLMSDGENTSQYQLTAPYKSGASPVFVDAATGSVAVYHAAASGANKYYVIASSNYSRDWRYDTMGTWQATAPAGYRNVSWPEATSLYPTYWIATRFFGNALGTDYASRVRAFRATYADLQTSVGPATKDSQLQQACDLAKSPALRIKVFSVAFEAPLAGQTALHNCASSDGDYFDVAGTDIVRAFQSIALQVSQLRLTQ